MSTDASVVERKKHGGKLASCPRAGRYLLGGVGPGTWVVQDAGEPWRWCAVVAASRRVGGATAFGAHILPTRTQGDVQRTSNIG